MDDYNEVVYEHKYSTSPERLDRYLRRQEHANKKEQEIFSQERTDEDLKAASEVGLPDPRVKDKLWRRPKFFDLEKPQTRSATPKEDFFKEYGDEAKQKLRNYLMSPNTRCFKDLLYREHENPL